MWWANLSGEGPLYEVLRSMLLAITRLATIVNATHRAARTRHRPPSLSSLLHRLRTNPPFSVALPQHALRQ